MITIDLTIEAGEWNDEDFLLLLSEKVSRAVMRELQLDEVVSNLSLLFTDDQHIQAINAQWRNKNKPTNVLSFPAFPIKPGANPGPLLGDVAFAYETIKREALEEKKKFEHHLAHMMVHGILHLLGYDHITDEEAEEMEKFERKILHALAIADPYTVSDNN